MIKKLTLRNFRGHTRVFEFGPHLNVVRGQNEAGKSTIKEAIAFAWFGSDSAGKSADHLISVGQEWAEVIVETEYVTLTRNKKRGKTPTIKLMQTGYPSIDLNQTELSTKLKLSIEAFMSCWNVGYFTTLTTPKQLAVLGELAKTDRREMLTELMGGQAPPDALKLDNIKVAADSVATKRRQLQNIKASEEGALSQLEAQIDLIKKAESADSDSYQLRLNEINATLSEFDLYSKELARYRSQFTAYQLAVKNRDEAVKGAEDVKDQLSKLPQIFGEQKIKDAVRASDELKKEADRLRGSLQPAPATPKKPVVAKAGECQTCGQPITEAHIQKVMGNYESQLVAYNQEARDVETHNSELLSQAKTREDQAREFYQESVDMYRSDDRVRQETNRLAALGKKYETALSTKVDEPKAPRRPEGDEEALKKEQLHINTELNLVRRRATELATLLERHEQISQALASKEVEIARYGRLEKAILDLPALETQRTLETIKIPKVGISLVDGDLSIVDDKGVPYQSLSSGRKMKVNSLICSRLRAHAGTTAPKWLFIDDTDLMDTFQEFIPKDLQVFVVKVDPKLKDVVVDIV